MKEVMTAEEWSALLPVWPTTRAFATSPADLLESNFVEVLSVVPLYEAWPGLDEPDEQEQAEILERVGRWCVTRGGVACLGTEMFFEAARLDEPDWLYHVVRKRRIYDPSDFLYALEAARRYFRPDEDDTQREAALQLQVQFAEQRRSLMIHPAILRQFHVYLAHRLWSEDEREGFCQFLAERGYSALR